MIVKSYLLEQNLDLIKENSLVLFYGENLGLKNDFKKKLQIKYKKLKIITFYQDEIINNNEMFFNEINNISLFDDKKIYFIDQASDKILEILENLKSENNDFKLFIFSEQLDKKSKLRTFFEKSKTNTIIPCYEDNEISIKKIISYTLKEFDNLTPQITNLIADNCNMNRIKLNNELEKIIIFFQNKKLNIEKIEELLNLKTNDDFNKLKDQALLGNKEKTNILLSDTIFEEEKNLYYLNLINQRLSKINEVLNSDFSNIEISINNLKPPIFWKDKPNFIAQTKKWNKEKIKKIFNDIYELELKLKSNSTSKNILFKKFIVDICCVANA